MWLPKPIYEALPFVLFFLGMVLGVAGYLAVEEWLQTGFLVGGSLFAVAGLVLLLKRRDYRNSRSRIKYDNLD